MSSPLPAHIEQRYTEDGRVYYVNHETSQTTWERPIFQATPTTVTPPSAQTLPAGWEARVDPGSGRSFYVDHANGRTQWDFPRTASFATQPTFQPEDFSNLVPSRPTPSSSSTTTTTTTSRSWACGSCGYGENLPESSTCVVCQEPRSGGGAGGSNGSGSSSSSSFPSSSSSSSSNPTSWNCGTCTLENDIALPNCYACNTARPAEFDNVVASLGIAASKEEEVSQLPSSAWSLDPPRLEKKDEPTECQHPGCETKFGMFQRTHHLRHPLRKYVQRAGKPQRRQHLGNRLCPFPKPFDRAGISVSLGWAWILSE